MTIIIPTPVPISDMIVGPGVGTPQPPAAYVPIPLFDVGQGLGLTPPSITATGPLFFDVHLPSEGALVYDVHGAAATPEISTMLMLTIGLAMLLARPLFKAVRVK